MTTFVLHRSIHLAPISMKNFKDKTCVITGAASGFGREFAIEAAARGMKLVLADIAAEPLEKTIAEMKALGASVVGHRCDVSNGAEVEALAELVFSTFGGVHLLFNNAGVGSGGLLWENTEKDWQWVLGVNLWGVIHGVRAFVPRMLAQAKTEAGYDGYVVNTSSMAGLLSPQLMGAYNVSKHAVVALSETLYHDLATVDAPIGCSVLCPAFVPTGISKSHRARPAELLNESAATESMKTAQSMIHKAVSSGRLTAADVAKITFDAIEAKQFYIITHQKIMATVQMRLDDIAKQQNPRDPFELESKNRPKVGSGG